METILTNYLTQIIAWLESGAGFIQKEMPLYIEELIRYKTIYISIVFFLLVFVIFFTFTMIIFANKKIKQLDLTEYLSSWDQKYDTWMAVIVIFAIVCIAAIGFLFWSTNALLKIHIAPRVYLIDYLKTIIQ